MAGISLGGGERAWRDTRGWWGCGSSVYEYHHLLVFNPNSIPSTIAQILGHPYAASTDPFVIVGSNSEVEPALSRENANRSK